MRACFFDTWAYLALANRRDPHHALASEADRALEETSFVEVTSDYVVDETLTGLQVSAGSRAAVSFLDVILAGVEAQTVLMLEVDRARRDRAFHLFRRLAPQAPRLSFTDCTSIALMQEMGIDVAFSGDRHFYRGGRGMRPLFEDEDGKLTLHLPR